jgi:hypothetical protein
MAASLKMSSETRTVYYQKLSVSEEFTAILITMTMEAVSTSETYKITWCNFPEDSHTLNSLGTLINLYNKPGSGYKLC